MKPAPFSVYFLLLIAFLFTTATFSQDTEPDSISIIESDSSIFKLEDAIEKLKTDPTMKNASWGFCVLTADSGKIISCFHEDSLLIPASTMKAITTAAALKILGKDFKFSTKLQYDGFITNDSTLNGNIYITGGGDPTLGSPRLDSMNDVNFICSRWVQEVKKLGIKKINGAVIGDASIFDDSLTHTSWVYEDKGRYYGAGVSGLNFHENYFQIFFRAGAKYKYPAKITDTVPVIPYINIKNNIKTGSIYTSYNVNAFGNPYDNKRILKGVTPRNKIIQFERVSIPDPAYFCAYVFSKSLSDGGIVIRDTATTIRHLKSQKAKNNKDRKTFFTQYSPSLDSIAKMTNISSINTYAEALTKMVGLKVYNSGTYSAGTKAITEFLEKKNLNLKGFTMNDGSGLSVKNRISPRQLASILRAFISDSMYSCFKETLPVAGKSGSISKIFKDTYAENNLIAKSGYMRKLRSYTGYVSNKNGKLLTFAIIVNNHNASAGNMKSKLEKIMVLIAETK